MFNQRRCAMFTIALCLVAISPAQAALFTFVSRAVFNAGAPGLPIETFEAGLVGPGAVVACPGPVNSTTSNACFSAGGLLPGIEFSAAPGPLLALIGGGFVPVGNTSKVLGPNTFAHTFDITFANANAVGFDLFPGVAAATVQISVFGPGNVLLGLFNFPTPFGGTFWGVISDSDQITRINLQSLPNGGELIDNIAFGTAGPSVIPEPSSLALLGVGTLGLHLIRRRRRVR